MLDGAEHPSSFVRLRSRRAGGSIPVLGGFCAVREVPMDPETEAVMEVIVSTTARLDAVNEWLAKIVAMLNDSDPRPPKRSRPAERRRLRLVSDRKAA